MSRPDAPKPEHVEFIRQNAGSMNDVQMGEALGLTTNRVWYIRDRNGIPRFPSFWTEARIEQLKVLYIVRGLTSEQAGEAIGCSAFSVRRKAAGLGLKRDRAYQILNQVKAQRSRAQAIREVAPPARAESPVRSSGLVGADDADLIAIFLAERGATQVPAGAAAGLTAIEGLFWTAPAHGSWKEMQETGRKSSLKNRAAA